MCSTGSIVNGIIHFPWKQNHAEWQLDLCAVHVRCSGRRKPEKAPRTGSLRQSPERGSLGAALPEPPGPGWAWRQRHRVVAPRSASRRGAAYLPGSGELSRCSLSLHICASGTRDAKRAAGRLQHSGCRYYVFFIFWNKSFPDFTKTTYIWYWLFIIYC